MKLYHATYQYYKDAILQKGLLLPQYTNNDNWGISGNYIYVSNDMEVAISFAECADNVDDEIYKSGIIVFAFDSNHIDKKYISLDDNNKDNTDEEMISTFQISTNIPPQYLSIVYQE